MPLCSSPECVHVDSDTAARLAVLLVVRLAVLRLPVPLTLAHTHTHRDCQAVPASGTRALTQADTGSAGHGESLPLAVVVVRFKLLNTCNSEPQAASVCHK